MTMASPAPPATGTRGEVIKVLAAQAPDLHQALEQAKADGVTHLVLDGKLFSCDRLNEQTTSTTGKQIDAWYSGKAHHPGGNVQAVMAPNGFPLWVSDVAPGSTHDLTAARDQVLGALYWAASQLNLPTLADGGYTGAGIGVHTPIRQPPNGQTLAPDNRTYNTRAPRPTLPRRTRLRPPHRPLANPPPHHHQPPQNRRHRQSRTRPHQFRTRQNHLNLVEITSMSTYLSHDT